MRQKITAISMAIFLLVTAIACEKQEMSPPDDAYQFEDALGRMVSVENPQRVVAMMGGFAETWLLAGGDLVGVTSDAVEERQLNLSEDIAIVGTHTSPNAEAILALEPDLVILSAETAAHLELQQLLENAGVTTAYFSVTHFSDYLEMLEVCTEITGHRDLYQTNGLQIHQQIEALLADESAMDRGTALLLITYSGGTAVQTSESMAGRMLQELGYVNLADENPSLLKEFSMEAVVAHDPDFIFVISMGNDDELAQRNLLEAVEQNPVWNQLTAVKEGRYILLPKELFLYKPNAGWADSYNYLVNVFNEA